MTLPRIKAIVFLVLALAAAIGAHAWRPTVHLSDSRAKVNLETMFPKAFGDWQVDDRVPVQLVSPDQQAVLSKIYNQTLSRTYINPKGDRIMLSVAYGGDQSDGTRAHRPEVCYPSQGFQLVGDTTDGVVVEGRTIPARKLVAQLGNRIEPITYWVTVGDLIATSGTQQKLTQLRYSTRGIIPDGMLVRVSSIDNDVPRAFQTQQVFIDGMSRVITGDAKSRIFGSPRQ